MCLRKYLNNIPENCAAGKRSKKYMQKINLNIACGYNTLEEFINLDNSLFLKLSQSPFYFLIKPFLSADHRQWVEKFRLASKTGVLKRQDCRKAFKYKNNSVDHILCSHFLEHLFHDQGQFLISEFYRILKPGGTIHIILPDLEKMTREYIKKEDPCAADEFMASILAYEKSGISLRAKILDVTGNYGFHHLWMYDKKSIKKKLEDAGFTVFQYLEVPSSSFLKDDGSLHIFGKVVNSGAGIKKVF